MMKEINPKNNLNFTADENTEEALARIINGSPVPAFVINSQHIVIHWNTALEATTGIKKEEIIGTDKHWKAFQGSQKQVLADLILDGASAAEIEDRYQGKSCKSQLIEGAFEAEDYFPDSPGVGGKWLHFTASPIRDKDQKIIGVIETLEDITERKKAEQALRESESNYRNLFESALDAIWVFELKGNIQAANESAARLTGYSVKELDQSNIKLFLNETSLSQFQQIQAQLLEGHTLNNSYEQKIVRKDGSTAICMVTTNQITLHGHAVAFQTIARDVTEEKRYYENQNYYLKEITRAQEEERKRIARELHDSTAQNLIALMHQIENMLDDKATLPMSQAKKLWVLYERIRDILQEVRRFSRDLRPSILDDLGLLPALEWLSEELKLNFGIDTKLIIIGEERRLIAEAELLFFRIVQESLMNIVKHAHANRAEVKVEFTGQKILIVITDNGIGFSPPENVGSLLQSGKLGLAGMEERVQLLGGKLKISSEANKGTTVQVEASL
jgi:PAS domain S-box-containing protein